MKVHLLDPRKVSQLFGVPCRTLQCRGDGSIASSHCRFELGPEQKTMLSFGDQEPEQVQLSSGSPTHERVSIFFGNITRVAYDEKWCRLILESHTSTHFSVLTIRNTGDIELTIGEDAAIYDGSGWDEDYRAATEKHDRRLQELRALPYQEYLLTPEWQQRRKAQLARSGYRCQVCNVGRVELQVHHRTYERRGNEALEDLITLCRGCHDLFHQAGKLASEGNEPPS